MTPITLHIVEGYSLCPRKAFLLMTGATPSPGPHDYEMVIREQAEANRQVHRARLEKGGEVVPFGRPAERIVTSKNFWIVSRVASSSLAFFSSSDTRSRAVWVASRARVA